MKKVAIVTIISRNYGNRLQNYALQRILEQHGVLAETIPMEKALPFQSQAKYAVKELLSIFIPKYKNSLCWDKFNHNIKWSKYVATSKGINNYYNYFIAGSDQIWNPTFPFNTQREFLTFVQNNKRIAYAASIGLDTLPSKYEKEYKENINTFQAVSVREDAAADIIEKIGCCRPQVVLDPTMLLKANEWRSVADRSQISLNERYIVKYFLGPRCDEYDCYIENCSKKMNAIVIDISDFCKKEPVGPSEFVRLICDAEAVFTDSFHGSVFSILFKKPFAVFERPFERGYGKMSSRIDTLLRMFQLERQRVTSSKDCKSVVLEWDYNMVDDTITEQRQKSMDFLFEAIGIR